MQLSLSARYFNVAVNNAWRVVSMESIEGGMHGWDDSCVTQDRDGVKAEWANNKYAVNVNGQAHQKTPPDTRVMENVTGKV